jgi:hypothetical protein
VILRLSDNMAWDGSMNARRNGGIQRVLTGDPVYGSGIECGDCSGRDDKRQESRKNTHDETKEKTRITRNLEN